MAVLGSTFLNGVTQIPHFISGTADVGQYAGITTASRMVFQMATSPVSWTKVTTVNEGMLRVINGASLVPGGSITFTQAFPATKAFSGSLTTDSINTTISPGPSGIPGSTNAGDVNPPGSIPSATIGIPEMAPHPHQYAQTTPGAPYLVNSIANSPNPPTSATSGATGGGGSHNHTFSGSHSHTYPGGTAHTHPFSSSHAHPTVSGTLSFNVLYVDMIVATKN